MPIVSQQSSEIKVTEKVPAWGGGGGGGGDLFVLLLWLVYLGGHNLTLKNEQEVKVQRKERVR